MIKIFVLLLILLVGGCSMKNTTNREAGQDDGAFMEYVSSLDKIPLPLRHSSTSLLPDLSRNYSEEGFQKFKHTSASHPLGVLFENNQAVLILEYSIGDRGHAPFIMSYDRNGNKIDSLGIYKKSSLDIGYDVTEYLIITNDRVLTVVDSVKRWDLNESGDNIVAGSMKVNVNTTTYEVGTNGRILSKPSISRD